MGITEVVTAPRSPWQNAYVERVIGSIRRECLDHVIVINERHLRRVLFSYVDYYHRSRTHLSLDKDPECSPHPTAKPRQRDPPFRKSAGSTLATNASLPDPLSRTAQSPAVATAWRAMPSRAESPWRTPNARSDQRDRGWSVSDSARAFRHTHSPQPQISHEMQFCAGAGGLGGGGRGSGSIGVDGRDDTWP